MAKKNLEIQKTITPSVVFNGIKERIDWCPDDYKSVMDVIRKGVKKRGISEKDRQGWVKCFLRTLSLNIEYEKQRRDGLEQGRSRVLEILQRVATDSNTFDVKPERTQAIAGILEAVDRQSID